MSQSNAGFVFQNVANGGRGMPSFYIPMGENHELGSLTQMLDNFFAPRMPDDAPKFPAIEGVIQAFHELESAKKHMVNFIEYTKSLKGRASDLPEKVIGEHNLGALISSSESLSKNMDVILKAKDLCIFSSLGRRIVNNKPKALTADEWTKLWMDQKELTDEVAPENCEEACGVCCSNMPNVVIRGCTCKTMNICAACILKHYYANTEQCTKSSGTCPFCKAEFKLDQIVPSKPSFVESRIKFYCIGRELRGSQIKCGKCGQRNADAAATCCPKAIEPSRCAECFFGEIYDREVLQNLPTCSHCNKKNTGFVVNRPFNWQAGDKRRKL